MMNLNLTQLDVVRETLRQERIDLAHTIISLLNTDPLGWEYDSKRMGEGKETPTWRYVEISVRSSDGSVSFIANADLPADFQYQVKLALCAMRAKRITLELMRVRKDKLKTEADAQSHKSVTDAELSDVVTQMKHEASL